VLGIELRVDWSVTVVFALLTWGLATTSFPALAEGYKPAEYWAAAGVTTLVFMVSLLAHETSHSLVARRRGIRVRDITLWLFGGVATLEGEARTPRADFAIAIAGPAASIAIGIIAGGIGGALALAQASALAIAAVLWLGAINIVLALFNLVPAAPLDGGRVLRAWLWHRSGDHDDAAIKAARAGHTFGWILVGLGVIEFMAGGDIGGLWFILLGWFLTNASRAEEMQVIVIHELRDVRVGDIMTPAPITAPASMSVAEILEHFVLTHRCSAFPLVEGPEERIVGLLTLTHCRAVPAGQRANTAALAVATPIVDVPTATPDELLIPALQRAAGSGGRILVMSGETLVGIVTPTDVTRALQLAGVQAR
jgi:Zn-dependent protease/CBS domain-containing protein